MRSTLNIDEELLNKATQYTGIKEKTKLVNMGLECLVRQEAARRLAALGGSAPDFQVAERQSRYSASRRQ